MYGLNMKSVTEFTLVPTKQERFHCRWSRLAFIYIPLVFIILFVTSSIVLSTEVEKVKCTITCVHRPICNVTIGNNYYQTKEGSCSFVKETADCHCYLARNASGAIETVSVNPFILLSSGWTLVAVLSGGFLVLFVCGCLLRCFSSP